LASLAGTILFIVFIVNLGIFFVGPTQMQAPMIGLLQVIFTPNVVNWSAIVSVNWSQVETNPQNAGAILNTLIDLTGIAGLFLVVSFFISPASVVQGSFATIHVPLVITASMFITFFAVPNFGAMQIPQPLGSLLSIFFGFVALMAMFDLFGGR